MGDVVKKDDGANAAGERMLALIRAKYPDYHPIMAIAEMAHKENVDDRLKLECHKTIVRYVTPELKSIEVKAEIKETRRVIVSMFDGSEVYENNASLPLSQPAVVASAPDPLWKRLESVEDALLIEEKAA